MTHLLFVLLYLTCNVHAGYSSSIPQLDCFPEGINISKTSCEERRCLWHETTTPNCYYPSDYGYFVNGSIEPTANGYTALISQRYPTYYDTDSIPSVRVDIYQETESRLHIKFRDEENKNNRYEVPIDLPPIPSISAANPKYGINFNNAENNMFGMQIYRMSDHDLSAIINTAVPGFIYSDQFIQFSMSITNYSKVYGFGERFSDILIPLNTTISLFSRDIWNKYPSFSSGYGVHPFGLFMDGHSGDSFGLLFINSNAMQIVLTHPNGPNPILQFRTIGGILDFYIFFGPKPLDVLYQFYSVVGFPFFPPYWSFGFHLCRWGYLNLNATKQIVESMRAEMIPYDTQWLDIDYMDDYKIFTYNTNEFEHLPQFIDNVLHKQYHMRFIQIIDCGISTNSSANRPYHTYDDGMANNVFISNENGTAYIGAVWPGGTVFPDFFNEDTINWWTNQTKQWHDMIKFDGIWIDMNEPSNFGGDTCTQNKYDSPPYFPMQLKAYINSQDMDDPDPFANGQHTICMNTQQKYGNDNGYTKHYNVHSLYGYSMMAATYKALLAINENERPFIISRSTYTSAGKYGGHWHGDNHADYQHLKQSISGMIMFSMFAMPMNGADICGFLGNTTVELCSRWIEVGAFYPFARNHNAIRSEFSTRDQDPPSLGQTVVFIHRKYLTLRYQLLPHLYTLFYKATQFGGNVINGLFMIWYDDNNTYDINEQYLWSESLLFSPALYKGQQNVNAYFPAINPKSNMKERWFQLENGKEIVNNGWNNIYTPLENTNIHIRGGSIIVLQNALNGSLTTYDARQKPYKLLVALDLEYNAKGDIFIDDGISHNYKKQQIFDFIEFNFISKDMRNCTLRNNVNHNLFDNTNLNNGLLDEIVIFGMQKENGNGNIVVNINDEQYVDFVYDSKFNVLKIQHLKLKIDQPFKIEFASQKEANDVKSEL